MSVVETLRAQRDQLDKEAEHSAERELATGDGEAEYVNPVRTLEQVLGEPCHFLYTEEWVILSVPTRSFGVHCRMEQKRGAVADVQVANELAHTALRHLGTAALHNRTLRPFYTGAFARHPSRVRKYSLSSEYSTADLYRLVALHNHCTHGAADVRCITRPPRTSETTGVPLHGYAIAMRCMTQSGGIDEFVTIEPRAYFANKQTALRDALVHALDPRSDEHARSDRFIEFQCSTEMSAEDQEDEQSDVDPE